MKTAMKLMAIATLFALLTGCAGWSQRFDAEEWAMAGVDTFFHAADWSTTKQLMGLGYEEYNPIIADMDQTGVASYFVATWAVKMLIAKALPHKQRKIWLGLGIINGAAYTANNLQLEGVYLWER